jgi:hypothetical protein
MNNRSNWIASVAVVLVVGALLYLGLGYKGKKAGTENATANTAAVIAEGDYPIGGTSTQFHEGRAEASVVLSRSLPSIKVDYDLQNITAGELDGAAGEDAVAVLGMTAGGKWYAQSLVAFLDKNGKMEYAGDAFLGDRIVVKNITIKDKAIFVDILTHGPNDYLDDPKLPRTLQFEIKDGKLFETR